MVGGERKAKQTNGVLEHDSAVGHGLRSDVFLGQTLSGHSINSEESRNVASQQRKMERNSWEVSLFLEKPKAKKQKSDRQSVIDLWQEANRQRVICWLAVASKTSPTKEQLVSPSSSPHFRAELPGWVNALSRTHSPDLMELCLRRAGDVKIGARFVCRPLPVADRSRWDGHAAS